MRLFTLRRLCLAAIAPLAVPLMASVASAAYPTNLMTFDTAGSITTVPGSSFNFTPNTTPNFRFDNGTATATSTANVAWTGAQDNTGNGGGSVKFNWTWNVTSDGAGGSAFDMDLTNGGAEVAISSLSFDIKVDASSTKDSFGGYGFFQPFTRNDSYSYDNVPDVIINGVDQHSNGWELGDPTFNATDNGWEHIVVPFSTPVSPRALVFQDFDDAGRDINGPITYYIDNVQLTAAAVPEPASLALLGLGVPALLMRRRAKAC